MKVKHEQCKLAVVDSKSFSHRSPDSDDTSPSTGNIDLWYHYVEEWLTTCPKRQTGKLAPLPSCNDLNENSIEVQLS